MPRQSTTWRAPSDAVPAMRMCRALTGEELQFGRTKLQLAA
jgi:hypothetical protein